MYIDRDAASRGGRPWLVRCEGRLYRCAKATASFMVPADLGYVDFTGSVEAPLTPQGPSFWVTLTGELHMVDTELMDPLP